MAWCGDRLKNLMQQSNLSIVATSEALDICVSSLVKYMSNKTEPSYKNLIAIADFYAVPVDYLLGRFDSAELDYKYGSYFNQIRRVSYEKYLLKVKGRSSFNIPIDAPWPYNLFNEIFGEEIDWIINEENLTALDYLITTKNICGKGGTMLYLYYRENKTLDEIADIYHVTRERIRQFIALALRALRQSAMKKYIQIGKLGYEQFEKRVAILLANEKKLNERSKELDEREAYLTQELRKASIEQKVEVPEKYLNDSFNIPLEELDLSVRSFNCLRRAGYNTITDVITVLQTEDGSRTIKGIRNLGYKSYVEVIETINNYTGYNFKVLR